MTNIASLAVDLPYLEPIVLGPVEFFWVVGSILAGRPERPCADARCVWTCAGRNSRKRAACRIAGL